MTKGEKEAIFMKLHVHIKNRVLFILVVLVMLAGLMPALAQRVSAATIHDWHTAPTNADWAKVQTGDTIRLGEKFTGEIKIPVNITRLTIVGYKDTHNHANTNITTTEGTRGIDLFLERLSITAPNNWAGITLHGNSLLYIRSACSVTGGNKDGSGNSICFLEDNRINNLIIERGSQLAAVSYGSNAIHSKSSLFIQNNGALNVTSGYYAIRVDVETLTISGTGSTIATGDVMAFKTSMTVTGGTVIARGRMFRAIDGNINLDGYQGSKRVIASNIMDGSHEEEYDAEKLRNYKYIKISRDNLHTWQSTDNINWNDVQTGDTIRLGESFTGEIKIPAHILELTIAGHSAQTAYQNTNIVTTDGTIGIELIIENLSITAPNNWAGIALHGNSTLRIKGDCSVTGGKNEKDECGNSVYFVSSTNGSHSLIIEEGAQLDAVCQDQSKIDLGAIYTNGSLRLKSDGVFNTRGGYYGVYAWNGAEFLGNGVTTVSDCVWASRKLKVTIEQFSSMPTVILQGGGIAQNSLELNANPNAGAYSFFATANNDGSDLEYYDENKLAEYKYMEIRPVKTHTWEREPGDWAEIINGDILQLGAEFQGELKIPDEIYHLTIRGHSAETAYRDVNIISNCAAGVNLIIENLNITAPNNWVGISLTGHSRLTVRGNCSITGGKVANNNYGNGIHFRDSSGSGTLIIGSGDSLTVVCQGVSNTNLTLGAIYADSSLFIQNDGALNTTGGHYGIGSAGNSTQLSGTGAASVSGSIYGFDTLVVSEGTVIATGKLFAVKTRLYFDSYLTGKYVTAGTAEDGSDAAKYDPARLTAYKYIKIERDKGHIWEEQVDWTLVISGDTIQLGERFTGDIIIPATIDDLTVIGHSPDTVYENVKIKAEGADINLVVENLSIRTFEDNRESSIALGNGNSTLTFKGSCTVNRNVVNVERVHGVYSEGDATICIEPDAELNLTGFLVTEEYVYFNIPSSGIGVDGVLNLINNGVLNIWNCKNGIVARGNPSYMSGTGTTTIKECTYGFDAYDMYITDGTVIASASEKIHKAVSFGKQLLVSGYSAAHSTKASENEDGRYAQLVDDNKSLSFYKYIFIRRSVTQTWESEIDWTKVESGDTIRLGKTFSGSISVPAHISELTIMGYSAETQYENTDIFASGIGTKLTIHDLNITASGNNEGILLGQDSKVIAKGSCEVRSGGEGIRFRNGSGRLIIEPNAQLTAVTSGNKSAVYSGGGLTIENNGILDARGGGVCIQALNGSIQHFGSGTATTGDCSYGISSLKPVTGIVIARGSEGAISGELDMEGYPTDFRASAGFSEDGAAAGDYDPEQLQNYKYIKITRVTPAPVNWSDKADDTAWAMVRNGDTICLGETFKDEINIPAEFTELTIMGHSAQTEYKDTNIRMVDNHPGIRLTIDNLKFTAPLSWAGLALAGDSSLTVRGDCAVSGGVFGGNGIDFLSGTGTLTILPDAQLNVVTQNNTASFGAVQSSEKLLLHNDGVLNASGGDKCIRSNALRIFGTGHTEISGFNYVSTSLDVLGGTVILRIGGNVGLYYITFDNYRPASPVITASEKSDASNTVPYQDADKRKYQYLKIEPPAHQKLAVTNLSDIQAVQVSDMYLVETADPLLPYRAEAVFAHEAPAGTQLIAAYYSADGQLESSYIAKADTQGTTTLSMNIASPLPDQTVRFYIWSEQLKPYILPVEWE